MLRPIFLFWGVKPVIRIQLAVLLAVSGTLFLAGCGDDPVPPEPTFPSNPGAITLGSDQLGLPMELNRSYTANREKYATHADDVSAVFIYEQIWSEYVQATEAEGRAELPDRVDDIYEEFSTELALFDETYLVVDLQRLDREWLVDWIGGSRDEPENRDTYLYFGHEDRDDYWAAVEERLVETAQFYSPDVMIIGMEMNRYYAQNPDDWDEFITFYWTMYDAVKAANDSVRLGVGFNWAYFMESQVAGFVQGEESVNSVDTFNRAYRAVIDPLVNRYDGSGARTGSSDLVGLAMIPDPAMHEGTPSEVPTRYFGALREAFPASGRTPIVFFQVGWPVSSTGSSTPQQFYDYFLANAGGVTIERLAWYGLSHLLSGDCSPLTSDAIGSDQTVCFRGLFSQSGADTALSEDYFATEEE